MAVRQLLKIPTARTIVNASTHSPPAARKVAKATRKLLTARSQWWSGVALQNDDAPLDSAVGTDPGRAYFSSWDPGFRRRYRPNLALELRQTATGAQGLISRCSAP